MQPVVMTLIIVVNVAFFAWTAQRRFRQLMVGRAVAGFDPKDVPALLARVKQTLVYAFGQRKMPYYPVAGVAHILVFGGFMVLLLRTLILWGRGYDASFDFFGLFAHGTLLGDAYSLVKDVFALGVIGGALVFVYYRVVRREKRMTLSGEGLLVLGIIVTMMVADMAYDGAAMVRWAALTGEPVAFRPLEPAGSLFGLAFSGLSVGTARVVEHAGFWTHSTLVLLFLNLLPYSKHFHVITSIPNVFAHPLDAPGRLPKVEDLEGKVEREEPVGIAKVTDLTWKHVLDLYTCTECGRCSDNCPAYNTDKKLSPKLFTLALRDHLYAAEKALIGGGPTAPKEGEELPRHEIHAVSDEHRKGAYYATPYVVDLVPNVVDPDVIWACTTCRACEEQCPVLISYVDKIVEMRRDQVMMKSEFPAELQKPFRGLETNANPWNLSAGDRADWAEGLDVALVSDRPDVPVLYWVGCSASYDDRAKKIARATAKLLTHAGVDFAILGPEEQCTGDPARRAGNEYLFQILAQANVETLNGYGAQKKTILTACPHCFNTLANEYKDFGGVYEVVHHADFLLGLVAEKKLVPTKPVEGKVAFHDSCYLGRYNGLYESPRRILEAIPGVQLEEVPYWTKSRGLCCGAGGAQMFMEEQNEERVNKKRLKQLVDTGATTVASACPFCMTMLTDGLKAYDLEEKIQQLDVAEMLERSVGV